MKNDAFYVEVDKNPCKECGYCIEVCPKKVFAAQKSFNDKGYRFVQVVEMEKCIGCLKCFYLCPDFAIDITKKEERVKQNEENI
ncbi:4Fe-4S dicluster domain-containing protein [Clostridium luticellarii]|jgi:NAD-dependent dihydropyrimidine dehydrogenase PreA subunit|uniref:2-oxoglutarate-acceptor oxidoreductase subunit OorD n=1 Tax=Clostridium luticellarii TaxID=1691940 RepID=A0A2T0BD39_9CLOT|nr:4Fe-4S dicluster domain-containing protein [Clostridium luticellarii]PRR81727.1 2-oxoglutarate-acceptor oxidoreductase subunit OorD [Clostridium luticellarii]